jgi:hypothetical protein
MSTGEKYRIDTCDNNTNNNDNTAFHVGGSRTPELSNNKRSNIASIQTNPLPHLCFTFPSYLERVEFPFPLLPFPLLPSLSPLVHAHKKMHEVDQQARYRKTSNFKSHFPSTFLATFQDEVVLAQITPHQYIPFLLRRHKSTKEAGAQVCTA